MNTDDSYLKDESHPDSGGDVVEAEVADFPNNRYGTLSISFGVLGILMGLFLPIIAIFAPVVVSSIIFGHMGIHAAKNGSANNKDVAILGTVIGYLTLLSATAIFAFILVAISQNGFLV